MAVWSYFSEFISFFYSTLTFGLLSHIYIELFIPFETDKTSTAYTKWRPIFFLAGEVIRPMKLVTSALIVRFLPDVTLQLTVKVSMNLTVPFAKLAIFMYTAITNYN